MCTCVQAELASTEAKLLAEQQKSDHFLQTLDSLAEVVEVQKAEHQAEVGRVREDLESRLAEALCTLQVRWLLAARHGPLDHAVVVLRVQSGTWSSMALHVC
jgi:hypothetical protein